MHWFLVALGAPLIWSLVNHCDKFILSRYFKSGGSGGLMIFVGTIALPAMLILYLIDPAVVSISLSDQLILIVSGLLYNVAVLLYLFALEKEDASYVVPFWQLTPVFAYLFGIAILNEVLSGEKIFAGLIVLLGAFILSLEFETGKKITMNKKIAFMMIVSSALLALGYILFKEPTAAANSFSVSIFWNQAGMFVFAIICLCIPKFRREFTGVIKENSKKVLSLNIFEQAAETLGVIVNNYAILLAPAALVILIEYSFQPMFVFLEGILLTLLFPAFIKEDISRGKLIQKFISILIMAIGVYFVSL